MKNKILSLPGVLILLTCMLPAINATAAPDDFGYTLKPDTASSSSVPVGSTEGVLDVSPTGGASYTIPIKVPKGINGMEPSVSLNYNSQSGNGIAGWGCNVGGISAITRGMSDIYHDGAAKGRSRYMDGVFYLDGKRLIVSSEGYVAVGTVYYPEGDPFTKVTICSDNGIVYFSVKGQDGLTREYGHTENSQLRYTVNGTTRTHAWYITEVCDQNGNYMSYWYATFYSVVYPASITYGINKSHETAQQAKVEFMYKNRNDMQPFAFDGKKGNMTRLLVGIVCKIGNSVFRNYDLEYSTTMDKNNAQYSRLVKVTEKNGQGEALKPTILEWQGLPAFAMDSTTPTANVISQSSTKKVSNETFYAADLTGDGNDDAIEIANVEYITNYPGGYHSDYRKELHILRNEGAQGFKTYLTYNLGADISMEDLYGYSFGHSVSDFDGDGLNDFFVPSYQEINGQKGILLRFLMGKDIAVRSKVCSNYGYKIRSKEGLLKILTNDFNNDGKTDILIVEKGKSGNAYPATLILFGVDTPVTFNLSLGEEPQDVFSGDYDNDGMQDLLILGKKGYTIFQNKGCDNMPAMFQGGETVNGTGLYYMSEIWQGDFNGDGLPDFLYHKGKEKDLCFALNESNGSFSHFLAYSYASIGYAPEAFNCLVADFDNDGKQDAILIRKYRDEKFQEKVSTDWFLSTGATLSLKRTATSKRKDDAGINRYAIGDFNGDGCPDVMNYGFNCYNGQDADVSPSLTFYSNKNYNTSSGKIKRITDGLGNTTSISYASLADTSVYTRDKNAVYPLATYTLPFHVVSAVTESNGAAGSIKTCYQYANLTAHLQGKGILGMASVKTSDTTTGIMTESGISSWDRSFFVPLTTYTKVTAGSDSSETTATSNFVKAGNNNYTLSSLTTVEKDFDGDMKTSTLSYDTTRGTLLSEATTFGTVSIYKKVEYGDYVLAGGRYLPKTVTLSQKHPDDASVFTDKTTYTYNNYGQVTQEITHADTSLPLTKVFGYDTFGNRVRQTTSGSGVSSVTQYDDYDANGRYIVKTYTSVTPGPVTEYTYDIFGNKVTETDRTNAGSPLTTRFEYDGWGRLVRTISPTGAVSTVRYGWGNAPSAKYYVLEQGTGTPWVKTYYDARGRKSSTCTVEAKDLPVSVTNTYNAKGQLSQAVSKTGNLTVTETFTYDNRGRVTSDKFSTGKSTLYRYGHRSVTTQKNVEVYQKEYDAWGNVKVSKAPFSQVTYTYASCGKPLTATVGSHTVSMEYDKAGNQIVLNDPDAGTTTYEYDALGRVRKQTDARGKVTTTVYDKLGRVTKETCDGEETTYTYVTSGNGILQPRTIATGNNTLTYTYDQYGRLTQKQQLIDGLDEFTYKYTYAAKSSLLSSVYYPSGNTVWHGYDCYGNETSMSVSGRKMWQLDTNTNAKTTASLLEGKLQQVITRDDRGLLKGNEIQKEGKNKFWLYYYFNAKTGNLTQFNRLSSITNYEYDALERLTKATAGDQVLGEYTYHANGNIKTKTGIGRYTYSAEHPHAVAKVDNTDKSVSMYTQTVEYNGFGKVSRLTERPAILRPFGNATTLSFLYGPDRSRWKTELKKGTKLLRTTLFGEDYEQVEADGVTTRYLYAGHGVVYVSRKSSSGSTGNYYYMVTDHLGSVHGLLDADGNRVLSWKYDAWGQQETEKTSDAVTFYRGYGGHEMLPEFGLINMNGRLYDPALGRFLSPDNYVQLPDFSQSFNRYSYCLNNPLKYTDPSGELAWFVPVIAGAIIGAYAGASIQSGTAAFWNWNSNAWKGAITGGIIGATIGYGVSSALASSGGVTGLTTTINGTEVVAKSAGITSSILNSGSINIAYNVITGGNGDGAWKAGIVGLATGAWAITGGFGMAKGFGTTSRLGKLAGKLGYQMIGTASQSVGNNWASNKGLFSRVTLGLGPINLTLGKGQRLLQWENNLGNIAINAFGLVNTVVGGKVHFNTDNLTIEYTGGLMDIFKPYPEYYAGFSPHTVTGNSGLPVLLPHELHHLWHSRALNDLFL